MNLRRTLGRIKPALEWIDLRDVLAFGGIGATAHGLGMMYPPLAWTFGGLALLWLGMR